MLTLLKHAYSTRLKSSKLAKMSAFVTVDKLLQGSLTEGEGRFSAIDLLARTRLDQLIFILEILFTFFKASYLNKEVNSTEPSPSVSVPWLLECLPMADLSSLVSCLQVRQEA
jgi:hypothetical protein